jgi:hypothetical protein
MGDNRYAALCVYVVYAQFLRVRQSAANRALALDSAETPAFVVALKVERASLGRLNKAVAGLKATRIYALQFNAGRLDNGLYFLHDFGLADVL